MKNFIVLFVLFVAVIVITGCKDNSRPADLPPLVSCEVMVIQDEKPLKDAVVSLIGASTGPNAKYQASGVTNAEGKTKLSTYGYEGVPEGQYKVCIWKDTVEGVKQFTNDDGEISNTDGKEFRTVDLQYFSADKTPLSIDIKGKSMPLTSFDIGKSIKKPKN